MFVGVAGVSSLVREDQVRELLAKCGKVEELRVYRDNTDPRQRTVCVNFEKEEDGMVALHLTDKFLIDRLIKVERLDNWPRGIQEITFQGEPVRRAPPPSAPVPAPKPAAAAAAAAAGRAPQQQQQQQGQQQQQPAPAASKPDAPAATSTATSAAATGASAHTPAASKETPEPSPEVYVADVPTTVAKPDLILFFTRACGPVRTIDVRGDAVHTPRYAVLTFTTKAGADAALKLEQPKIDDKPLRIFESEADAVRRARQALGGDDNDDRRRGRSRESGRRRSRSRSRSRHRHRRDGDEDEDDYDRDEGRRRRHHRRLRERSGSRERRHSRKHKKHKKRKHRSRYEDDHDRRD